MASGKHGEHGKQPRGDAPREKEGDPIADYREWTDHRYDPGYFTGGRLPPTVRAYQKILKPRDKRVLLILLMIAGLVMVLGAIWPLFR